MKNELTSIAKARRFAVEATGYLQQVGLLLREIGQVNKLLQICHKTLLDAPYQWYLWLYFILLITDAAISAPMIQLLTGEGQRLDGWFWQSVFFILYFSIIGAVTTIASEYYAVNNSQRHINFYLQIRSIAMPQTSTAALEFDFQREARRKKRTAWVMVVLLGIMLAVMCLYRIYVVNGRHWNFRLIDTIHLLPLGLMFLLLILGKYKGILIKKVLWQHKHSKIMREYRQERAEADKRIVIMVDILQEGNIDLNHPELPAEIKACIHHYRENNPYELLDDDQPLAA